MRTSERKHNYVSEERLAEKPPGVVARRAAACMVRHHCKAFWLCLVLMAAATCGVILPGGFPGRFKFRSSYSFEMYIAGDPLTDHGDAIYQIERRPQDMLAHLRGERVAPRDHVVAKEEENFGRPWRQRRRLSEATPPPPPPETCAPLCCEAMTASCLACKECTTVDAWCAANPSTEWPGCESADEVASPVDACGGCEWTKDWACPGGRPGSEGYARPDGSRCFAQCCGEPLARGVRSPEARELLVISYCWRDPNRADDILGNAGALQQVCDVENVVLGAPSYDTWCYQQKAGAGLGREIRELGELAQRADQIAVVGRRLQQTVEHAE